MRADAHYVDQLDAPPALAVQVLAIGALDCDEPQAPIAALVESIRRHGVLEPLIVQKRDRRHRIISGRKRLAAAAAAGLREVPCIVRRVADDEAQTLAVAARAVMTPAPEVKTSPLTAVDDQIACALATVVSATAVLGAGASPLTETVTLDTLRAEAQRALCMLRAAAVVRGGPGGPRGFVAPRAVVERVADLVAADARLRGIVVETSWTGTERALLNVNDEQLAGTLGAVVLSMFSALRRMDGAGLIVSASIDAQGVVTLAIEQKFVVAPESWLAPPAAAAEDGADSGHLVPLIALRQLAEASGGRLVTSRLPHATRVAVDLPSISRR